MNEELRQLDVRIFKLNQQRRALMKQIPDAFTRLGEDAPFFRAIFANVNPPIKNKDEFIKRAGGPTKLIHVTSPRYGVMTFALLDILDAVKGMDRFFPIENFEAFVKKVKQIRNQANKMEGEAVFAGWGKVPTKNLDSILERAKVPPIRPKSRTKPTRRIIVSTPCVNTELLKKLSAELKRRAEKQKVKGGK